jgi:acetoin utilization deacetylase AcuC-like enzyme
MLIHSKKYTTDLTAFGIDKPFALDRGERVLAELRKHFPLELIQPLEPQPISAKEALLVHTSEYLQSLKDPRVWQEIFELKASEYKPESATRPLNELFDDIALKCGGTKLAVELACRTGSPTANLGGGYHHAFPGEGRGFCVLNDIAIAIRAAQEQNLCRHCLIVDVDFHQGDGTALIFQNDPTVFTLSIHSQEGWPECKQQSDIDVSLSANETCLYQTQLERSLEKALTIFSPDLAVFVAGSDAYEKDVLPGTAFMKMTLEQMRHRDEWIIDTCADRGIPLAMVFAGGYGPDVWEVHYWATRRIVERCILSTSSHS